MKLGDPGGNALLPSFHSLIAPVISGQMLTVVCVCSVCVCVSTLCVSSRASEHVSLCLGMNLYRYLGFQQGSESRLGQGEFG